MGWRGALLYTLLFCRLISAGGALSESYEAPLPGDDVIGEIRHARVGSHHETLLEVARDNDVGYREIVRANMSVNRWLPERGTSVVIPSMHILPEGGRTGLLLNLAELRLYYFPKGSSDVVYTYPVSIGRMDWETPKGITRVVRKEKNPAWRPPASIRAEHAEEEDYLPAVIPGGDPENPLGLFALRLALPAYLIHGTDEGRAAGIGMRVTHGCIRLYPEDIEALFPMVPVGTEVRIIDQPVKAGWLGTKLFLQLIRPLEEEAEWDDGSGFVSFSEVMEYLESHISRRAEIDAALVRRAVLKADGIPALIGEVSNNGL